MFFDFDQIDVELSAKSGGSENYVIKVSADPWENIEILFDKTGLKMSYSDEKLTGLVFVDGYQLKTVADFGEMKSFRIGFNRDWFISFKLDPVDDKINGEIGWPENNWLQIDSGYSLMNQHVTLAILGNKVPLQTIKIEWIYDEQAVGVFIDTRIDRSAYHVSSVLRILEQHKNYALEIGVNTLKKTIFYLKTDDSYTISIEDSREGSATTFTYLTTFEKLRIKEKLDVYSTENVMYIDIKDLTREVTTLARQVYKMVHFPEIRYLENFKSSRFFLGVEIVSPRVYGLGVANNFSENKFESDIYGYIAGFETHLFKLTIEAGKDDLLIEMRLVDDLQNWKESGTRSLSESTSVSILLFEEIFVDFLRKIENEFGGNHQRIGQIKTTTMKVSETLRSALERVDQKQMKLAELVDKTHLMKSIFGTLKRNMNFEVLDRTFLSKIQHNFGDKITIHDKHISMKIQYFMDSEILFKILEDRRISFSELLIAAESIVLESLTGYVQMARRMHSNSVQMAHLVESLVSGNFPLNGVAVVDVSSLRGISLNENTRVQDCDELIFKKLSGPFLTIFRYNFFFHSARLSPSLNQLPKFSFSAKETWC